MRKLLFLVVMLLFSGYLIGQTTCYPDGANYHTGSTDGSIFTQTSLISIESADVERGWARFNTSAIPNDHIVSSVELNIYISDDNYAYFRTMSIESDPLSGTAASVFADIADGTQYAAYTSNFPDPGWYVVDLGSQAASDLQSLLASDWFAVGLYEYESSSGYYLEYDGWSETNVPYVVVEHAAPETCPSPTLQVFNNITTSSVDLGWTENGSATTWDIELGETGFTPTGNPTANNVGTNPYTYGSLESATTYDWYVRADCAGDDIDVSTWVGPISFTTECETISSFPYNENFENGGSIPTCWTNDQTDAGGEWEFVTSNSHGPSGDHTSGSGYYALLNDYNYYSYESPFNLISQAFDFSAKASYQLKYWYWIGSDGASNPIHVDVSDDGGITWTDDVFVHDQSNTNAWFENTVDLSSFNSSSVVIRFRAISIWGSGTDNSGIDDVTIEEMPTSMLSYYNLQYPASASIPADQNVTVYAQCWEPGVTEPAGPGAGIECWIGYSTSNSDPSTWTNWVPASYNYGIDPNNNDEYQADLGIAQSLSEGTYYYASRFRYDGGPFTYGGYPSGAWDGVTQISGVLTVNPCDAASIPYFENFDGATSPDMPSCMAVENVNGDSYTWETNSSYSLSAPNCAYIRYNSSSAMDDWFFTQGLNLTGGVTYEVGFAYGNNSSFYAESLGVYWGSSQSAAGMTEGPIFDQTFSINGYAFGTGTFTPPTSGTYYIGFYGHSISNQYYLFVDDIYVVETATSASWNGAFNNDWWDAGNWDGGVVPSSSTNVTIPAGLTNYPTVGSVASCNDIALGSDASGAATLLDNGLLVIGGTASAQRYFSGNDIDWHLVSSPVGSATASVFTGMYLQSFDESSNGYSEITELGDPLNVMEGYGLYSTLGANNTVTFTGSFNQGPQSKGFTADGFGWNLFGNPFPSSIDWEAVSIPSGMSNEVHYIDAATGNDYSYVKGSGGTGSQYIAPMQGFFVSATSSGTLNLGDAQRTHMGADNFYKSSNPELLRLAVTGNGFTDETIIHFHKLAEKEHDGQFDAYKRISFSNPNLPQLFSYTPGGTELSVNGLPEAGSVEVGFTCQESGEFVISAIETGDFTDVILEDLYNGSLTNLLIDNYAFSYNQGDEQNRFIVHFAPVGINDNVNDNIHIYSFNKDVYVTVPIATTGTIQVFNMMGQEVASQNIKDVVNKLTLTQSAYYVVVVSGDKIMMTDKVFVK